MLGTLHTGMGEDFEIANGYFVLNETTLKGDAPRGDAQLMQIYKSSESLRASAYYEIPKHSVSTPFGYFIDDAARPDLEKKIEELRDASESYNELVEGKFVCLISVIFVAADVNDPVFKQRMCSFTLEKLYELKERLLTRDPRKHAKMLGYTHDTTKRLDMYLKGQYATAVQEAVASSKELVHEVRVGEHPRIEEKDLVELDAAIELFTKATENLEQRRYLT